MIIDMLNKFFTISAVLLGFVVNSSASHAQQCNVNYEMITKLYHPDIGSYTVWDSLYGQENRAEAFISVVNHGDGGVLAVGEVIPDRSRNSSMAMVLVSFDKRGRKVWDKYHFIQGLGNVVKMLPFKDGVVVLANRHKIGGNKTLWLGFFDNDGALLSQKTISDDKYNLFANDISHSVDGKGFAVSVTIVREFGRGKGKVIRKNAVVYLLDGKGNKLSSRSYILGADNEITGLSVSKFGAQKAGYIATGYFESPSGKKVGWALRLHGDLSYAWQKEYSRGLSAKIKESASYGDDYILIFADVLPVDGGAMGNWLALINSIDGEVMWQRYYYGETGYHDYSAKGLYVNGDGLITLLMMADVVPNETNDYMSYAHLLTLSPRGVTLSGDSYYNGRGVHISQLIEGINGSRIMAGYSMISIKDVEVKNDVADSSKPPPLRELGEVILPDAPLSDKAKAGLEMLKNKIKAQKIEHVEISESANGSDGVTQDGLVIIGEMPETYTDPCVREVRKLK